MSSILEKKSLEEVVKRSKAILLVEKTKNTPEERSLMFSYRDKVKRIDGKGQFEFSVQNYIIKEILFSEKRVKYNKAEISKLEAFTLLVNDTIAVCNSNSQEHLNMTKMALETDVNPMPVLHGLVDEINAQDFKQMILFVSTYDEDFKAFTATYGEGIIASENKGRILKLIDLHRKKR